MMNYRIQYLRDSKGQPTGCVVIRKDTDSIAYQFSVLNPLDKFDRAIARKIAIGRLRERPISISLRWVGDLMTKFRITKAVFEHMEVNMSVPARARKAAKLWLKLNQETGK